MTTLLEYRIPTVLYRYSNYVIAIIDVACLSCLGDLLGSTGIKDTHVVS